MSALARNPEKDLQAHRFFFALKFDDVTARRLRALAEQMLGAKGLLRWEHLHMTLALGEDMDTPSEAVIAGLRRAGDAVALPAFEIILGQLSASRKSIALRPDHVVPPLRALLDGLAAAMAWEGVAMRADWRASPHVTLGYRSGEPFSRPVTQVRWPVTQFVLVHSLVGLGRHETIASWDLTAGEAREADKEDQYRLL